MVAGIQLLDAIVNSPPPYGGDSPVELQVRTANELVAACLDQHRHNEALDVCGPTGKWRRVYVRETEAEMRQLHEQWMASARPLYERVKEMRRAGHQIGRFQELMDAVFHTQTLLMTTVDDLERAREQVRRGEVFTLEEVRRKLRARTGR